MIVAKTSMKKIPERCNKCALSIIERYSPIESVRWCAINGNPCEVERTGNGNRKYIRPKWCPLIEENGEKHEST